jgi:hypothetical protein
MSSVAKNACILVRYLPMDVLFLSAFFAGMYLPTRYIAMGIHVATRSATEVTYYDSEE